MKCLLIVTFLYCLPCFGKAQGKKCFSLFRTSAAINAVADSTEKIKRIRRLDKLDSLQIKTCTDKIFKVNSDLIWGFRTADGTLYRNYNHEFWEIEGVKQNVIYTRQSRGFRGKLTRHYYYSKNYDSPIMAGP